MLRRAVGDSDGISFPMYRGPIRAAVVVVVFISMTRKRDRIVLKEIAFPPCHDCFSVGERKNEEKKPGKKHLPPQKTRVQVVRSNGKFCFIVYSGLLFVSSCIHLFHYLC